MIVAKGLTKRYGDKLAVDHISFEVPPGRVTGFLGPNGAGKSTTMRMIMGLDKPTSGSVTVNGISYVNHKAPMTEVGALLEAKAVHPGRSARHHLEVLAATHGFPKRRVDEVIAMTGLDSVADQRVSQFSLGMGQRLGIASALLVDPRTLILDEPVNGLDPEGVLWVRNLAKFLASQGRTVFLSSHLMNEMAITADHVIVIGKGKILADLPIKDLVERGNHNRVKVVTPDAELLQQAVGVAGGSIPGGFEVVSGAANTPSALGLTSASAAGVGSSLPLPGEAPTRLTRRERRTGTLPPVHAGGRAIYSLMVEGLTPAAIGQLSLINGVELHELTPQASTLEEAYMELTHDSVEYQSLALGGKTPASAAPKAVHSNSGDPYATL